MNALFLETIAGFERRQTLSLSLVLVFMVGIFYLSSLTFSGESGYSPSWTAVTYHFSIFFGFAFFLLLGVVGGRHHSLLFPSLLFAFFYALSDEYHQLFVPGRGASVGDVFLDVGGICLAGLVYLFSLYIRKK